MTENETPIEKSLDSSIELMRDGYLFIKKRVDQHHSDVFRTRLFMQNVICISGREAAEIFYDPDLFQRHNAAPKQVLKTLFGENAIQTMDGDAHLSRKKLFISLMTQRHQEQLANLVMEQLQASIDKWMHKKTIVLFDEMKLILCRAVCQWAGVPLDTSEIEERANDFYAMIDGFGGIGERYLLGKESRSRAEKWIEAIIADVRSGKFVPDEDSPLWVIAFYKEQDSNLLDNHMAAVELINVLRPVIAVAIYIAFAAKTLHERPEYIEKIKENNENYLQTFAQEIRRYYPLTPFLAARVKKDFNWQQCEFSKDMLVLLDIYGTDHDSRIWDNPNEFRPERFVNWQKNLYKFIPQGGGDAAQGHRCPGEGITVEILKTSINFLINNIEYNVPYQDLDYSLNRIPTFPNSGFVMNNIRRK